MSLMRGIIRHNVARFSVPRHRIWFTIGTTAMCSLAAFDLSAFATISERLIGSIRRECLDHVVLFGERHLHHVLSCYMEYNNAARTHLSLGKDTPTGRMVQSVGRIRCRPVLGGLHHQYARI